MCAPAFLYVESLPFLLFLTRNFPNVSLLDILYAVWLVSKNVKKNYTNRDTESPLGGFDMSLKSIGRNIRTHRNAQKLSIEELAFKANLSKNYLALVERGEKIPSLETFLNILNALNISADEVLCDVVNAAFKVRTTNLSDQMEKVSPQRREMVYRLIEIIVKEEASDM